MNNKVYRQQSNNVFKTWLYLILFSLLVGMVGFLLASYFNNPIFFYLGTFISVGTSIWSYWFSSSMVLKMANAKEITQGENLELQRMVEKLANSAGIPMPKIYTIDDPSPNAFATGRNPENGVIAFTTGILSLLNKDELAGVAAHELTHIVNRDTLVMTVVAVMASIIQSVAHYVYYFTPSDTGEEKSSLIVGVISFLVIAIFAPLAATIVQMAISRKREFMADGGGATLTNYPQGLASALQKIHNYPQGMQNIDPTISHLFISDPQKDTVEHHTPWYMKLFMTHPPLEERIEALLGK